MRRSSRRTGLGSIRSRKRERIDGKPLGQFVDRLFEPEGAGRIARRAHRAARPRIDEHVVLRGFEIGTGVERLGHIADAGAERDAGRAVAHQRDRRQRPVAPRADAQPLPGRRAVAGIHLLFLAIEDDAHRRLRLARQGDGDAAVIAERRFGAEAAAHAVDDHAHAAERQAERLRQLVPHAGGELGGHMDRQPVRPPIGDDRVRLQAAMGLHLGAIFAFDDDIGLREALRHIAAADRLPVRAHCR